MSLLWLFKIVPKLVRPDPTFNMAKKGPALYDHSLPVASNQQIECQLQNLLILLDCVIHNHIIVSKTFTLTL